MSDPIFDIGRDLQRAYDEGYEKGKADAEQKDVSGTNAGELISRQAVIDRINKLIDVEKKQGTDDWGYGRERVNAYEAMLHFVGSEYLHPSVEPERPHGKWIRVIDPDVNAWTGGHTCSECGRACVQMSMNYCANCGADMRGEQALKYADNDTAFGGLQSAT